MRPSSSRRRRNRARARRSSSTRYALIAWHSQADSHSFRLPKIIDAGSFLEHSAQAGPKHIQTMTRLHERRIETRPIIGYGDRNLRVILTGSYLQIENVLSCCCMLHGILDKSLYRKRWD